MKLAIILLIIDCIILSIIAIINTFKLCRLRRNFKKKYYYTPKLSELHGKDFTDYIDNLKSGLY